MKKRSYKFRIFPKSGQETLLRQTLELCRQVYNDTLAARRNSWQLEQISLSKFDTNKLLTDWKEINPKLYNVHSQVLQNIQDRVDLAFQNFFRRVKDGENPGYPRFKSEGRYDSITYPQYGNGVTLKEGKLHLSKIGSLEVKFHRQLPATSTIKRVTIKRESNQWFVSFSLLEEPTSITKTCGTGTVGIDLGCKTFAVLSDGSKIENPKFLKQSQDKIDKAKKKMEKQPKGSPEWKNKKKILTKVHQKVGHQRDDFLHKESKKLVNKYETLVFEDLDIQKMLQEEPWKKNLHRTILDSSWDKFTFYCFYKAEDAGGKVIKVNPKNTSKMCSECGNIQDMPLEARIYSCSKCGSVKDRDFNSSINILRLGQKSLVTNSLSLVT